MISALVVAAGFSRRMGQFKLLLPWGDETVIAHVVHTLEIETPGEIVVVTGHRADEVATALEGTRARLVTNPDYATGEMLSSVQAGLRALGSETTAALICLGDQPQMEAETVRRVVEASQASGEHALIIPSYQMRAGHPVLLPCRVWPDVLAVATGTLKEALAPQRAGAVYVTVDTPSVLADLDTPGDYGKAKIEIDGKHLR